MEKITDIKVKELIEKQNNIKEKFDNIRNELKKMDDEVYKIRQEINHGFNDIINKSEKTLMIGQLRTLNAAISQIEETIAYFESDKHNEISEILWNIK